MHAVGLHSALAIKRQRKRRDEHRRARERRYSSQSGESSLTSPRASVGSFDQYSRHKQRIVARKIHSERKLDSSIGTSIGMLHIGVVFLVLGAFLVISGISPSEFTSLSMNGKWWNELIAMGLFFITVGSFLTVLNRILTKKEEDDLEQYIQRQLTRSKSGHRLEKDVETGGLTTKYSRRFERSGNPDVALNLSERAKEQTEYSCQSIAKYSSDQNNLPTSLSLLSTRVNEDKLMDDKSQLIVTEVHTQSYLNSKKYPKNTLDQNESSSTQHYRPFLSGVS